MPIITKFDFVRQNEDKAICELSQYNVHSHEGLCFSVFNAAGVNAEHISPCDNDDNSHEMPTNIVCNCLRAAI